MSVPPFEKIDTPQVKPWLVTGGAGYIGGHVTRALCETGIPVVLLDIDQDSARQKFSVGAVFENCDIRDKSRLKSLFANYQFEGVVHLAALKSVEDSQSMQKEYFETNVNGTKNILEIMNEFNVSKFIYSSSAAVYEAQSGEELVNEESSLKPVSYYGQTKVDSEELIMKFSQKQKMTSVIFRYFNVAGAASPNLKDKSTQNLIPITINKIKLGMLPEIFGDDYNTPDGTAIRDYVDVRDIANAHLKAISYLSSNLESCVLNIGTGHGASVREVISMTQEIMGSNIAPLIKSRRPGDISAIAADCTKAREVIGFESNYILREMIETSI
jgi:UDP-glucose 4-epimerase